MFYSHEILTSREGGLATVWLIATVGSKSATKKLSRKSILDVNVPRTCDKIINPEAPMALRLQSNLLYGVSRVFSQQSGYLLSDAQIAQSNMRALLNAIRTSELDPNAGKARSNDQLILQDDPGFAPDFQLEMNLSTLDISSDESSRHSSLLSRQSLASSRSSQHSADGALPGIVIPTSDGGSSTGGGGLQVASDHGSSAHHERMQKLLDDDGEAYNFDPGFFFDASGEMFSEAKGEGSVARQLPVVRRAASESSVGEQVRRELAQAAGPIPAEPAAAQPFNFDPLIQDDGPLLPDAEPFPSRETGQDDPNHVSSGQSSETVTAPLRGRPRKSHFLSNDDLTMVRSKVLTDWKDDYLKNMAATTLTHQNRQSMLAARRNAKQSVLGIGIGNAGIGIGRANLTNPLGIFAGDNLMELLTGVTPVTGRKRDRDTLTDDDANSETRRQRIREEEPEVGLRDEMLFDEEMPLQMQDDIEIGRHAPTPIPDDATFPWNNTASAIASRSHAGSSIAGRGVPMGFPSSAGPASSVKIPYVRPLDRRSSRHPSSSPLGGRGVHDPSDEGGDIIMSDEPDVEFGGMGDISAESYEIHGPGAGVGTQTQAQSQWQAAMLDREAGNFLAFLKEEIERLPHSGENVEGEEDELATTPNALMTGKTVMFEELLPPGQHTSVVAAQALLHVLALATKGLVAVRQDIGFGDIGIVAVESAGVSDVAG